MRNAGPTAPLRMILVASGLIFLAAGVVLAVAVDPVVGGIVAAVGVADLVVAAIVGRSAGSGAAQVGPSETAEADPSYNPYARED